MKYLHTMVRVTDIEKSIQFYRDALGLKELSRRDYEKGRFTLVYLAAAGDEGAQVELTYNWDAETYTGGRNFGHLAFVRSPDNVSIELLQQGEPLAPAEPWISMPNTGAW